MYDEGSRIPNAVVSDRRSLRLAACADCVDRFSLLERHLKMLSDAI
jgi:hypothetical protein